MELDKDFKRRLKNDKDGCNMRVVRTAQELTGTHCCRETISATDAEAEICSCQPLTYL